MKQPLLLIAITICSLLPKTEAQNVWIDQGGEWYFCFSTAPATHFYERGYVNIKYLTDTTINNRTCNILQEYWAAYDRYPGTPQTYPDTSYWEGTTFYITVSGDTVFNYVNGQFYIMYDFGAQAGDSWTAVSSSCPSEERQVIVDSVGTVSLNNQTYRWINLQVVNHYNTTHIERIGVGIGPSYDLTGYIEPVRDLCNIEAPFMSFSSFEDNSFPLIGRPNGCEWVGVAENKMPEFSIEPNPANEFLNVSLSELENPCQAIIYNMHGQVVLKQHLNAMKTQLNLNGLSNGVYTLSLVNDKAVANQKFVVSK